MVLIVVDDVACSQNHGGPEDSMMAADDRELTVMDTRRA